MAQRSVAIYLFPLALALAGCRGGAPPTDAAAPAPAAAAPIYAPQAVAAALSTSDTADSVPPGRSAPAARCAANPAVGRAEEAGSTVGPLGPLGPAETVADTPDGGGEAETGGETAD